MTREPRKLASEIEGRLRPLKDVDAVERARLIFALLWLLPASLIIGAMVTHAAAKILGLSPGMALLVGFVLGFCGPTLVFLFFYEYVIGGSAIFLGKYFSDGSAPQAAPWRGQALSAKGDHAEAVKAFEEEAELYPDDPSPCLWAAAVLVGELDDPEAAIVWYQRAHRAAEISPETDAYVSMRLAELYESTGSERQATVELRRLLEKHPESEYATRARSWLAGLKAQQLREHEAGEDC